MTADNIIPKIVFTFILIPLAFVFHTTLSLILRPFFYSCAYSGICQPKRRDACTIFGFLICYPIFYVIFVIMSLLLGLIEFGYAVNLFYNEDNINKAVKTLFLHHCKSTDLDNLFGLVKKDSDIYIKFEDHECCQ